MITRLKKLPLALLALPLFFVLTSCAQTMAMEDNWEDFLPHSGQSLLDMLGRQEVVEMTLTADLDSLINHRNTDAYMPAGFSYEDEKGVRHSYQVKVKPRGKFRRRICDFPPLKLKFSKKELEAAGLSDMNELKLVTHCLDDKKQGNELVLREYLAYKMYNELTPMSLRAQLVKITYRDTHDKSRKTTRWGILVEDEEELEARKGGQICECMGQPKDAFHTSHERINSLFQYMIGNTDWSIEMNRNVKILRIGEDKLIPVPFDFDFSALVNAPYARPNADLRQRSIHDRVFMGFATSAEEIYSTASYFKSKKETLLGLVRNFKHLNQEARTEMIASLEAFYLVIGDMQMAQAEMFDKRQAAALEVTR